MYFPITTMYACTLNRNSIPWYTNKYHLSLYHKCLQGAPTATHMENCEVKAQLQAYKSYSLAHQQLSPSLLSLLHYTAASVARSELRASNYSCIGSTLTTHISQLDSLLCKPPLLLLKLPNFPEKKQCIWSPSAPVLTVLFLKRCVNFL